MASMSISKNSAVPVWDAVFPLLNDFVHVPACGLIAQYNVVTDTGVDGLPTLMQGAPHSLTIRGVIQREFVDQRPAFCREMANWITFGRFHL
uniref:Orf21Fr n=1 Tax=Mesorhizobium sp. CJ1 TaxID=447687 RepID=A6N7W8_9HYPH|nr:Orf21Fr [Mesorhizobium sp. CJ1]